MLLSVFSTQMFNQSIGPITFRAIDQKEEPHFFSFFIRVNYRQRLLPLVQPSISSFRFNDFPQPILRLFSYSIHLHFKFLRNFLRFFQFPPQLLLPLFPFLKLFFQNINLAFKVLIFSNQLRVRLF